MPCHLDEHISVFPIPSDTAAIFNPVLPPRTQTARMTCCTGSRRKQRQARHGRWCCQGTTYAIALAVADGLQQCRRAMAVV